MYTPREFILEKFDQVEIMSKYLEVSTSDIHDSINCNIKIHSPFRNDPRPSLSFKMYGTKLICRDFGDIDVRGDIFEIAGYILGKNSNNKHDFIFICNHITNVCLTPKAHTPKTFDSTSLITDPTSITFESVLLGKQDFRYFWQYFIPRGIVEDNWSAVSTYSINGRQSRYRRAYTDPCYAYTNNPKCTKLYFPYRDRNHVRFISNNKAPIECIDKIRKTDYTILIKGFKDKVFMDYVCSLLNITNVQFIPVASEASRLSAGIVEILKRYTNIKIFTMFDLDKCGVTSGSYYSQNYGFTALCIGIDYTTKDPTDLVRNIKMEKFLKLFKKMYECF